MKIRKIILIASILLLTTLLKINAQTGVKPTFPTDSICAQIKKETDEFTNEVNFGSPPLKEAGIKIYKYIKKGRVVYYLSLRAYGSTLNVNESGVIILFQDGTKWTRAEKIDVEPESDGYEYSAFIILTPIDVTTFSKKKIKAFRLYIYDKKIDSSDAENFTLYTQCIKNAK